MTSPAARRVAARFLQAQGSFQQELDRSRGMIAAADLSTPEKTADFLRSELRAMFPQHYVKVIGERGVGIQVAHMDDEAYAKKQLSEGYDIAPNLMVRISMGPGFGASGWTLVGVGPSGKNPELAQAGIKPIRRMSDITPEKGTEAILKWFKANQAALRG